MTNQAEKKAVAGNAILQRILRGVVPEAFGLAFAILLVVVVAASACVSYLLLGREARSAAEAHSQRFVRCVASALTGETDESRRTERFVALCGAAEMGSARLVDGSGRLLAQWPLGAATPPASSQPGAETKHWLASATIADSPGASRASLGTVFATARAESTSQLGRLLIWTSAIGGGALLAFLLLNAALRRHVRPHVAIAQNLGSFASGIERQFSALALSDTLGQLAVAWNHLVAHVAEMQQQSSAGKPNETAASAMKRFESRALRQVLDRLPLGVVRFGRQQTVSLVNAAALRLLRMPEDAIGRPVAEAIAIPGASEQVLGGGNAPSATTFEKKFGEDGAETVLRFSILPPSDKQGDAETVVTVEDVTHLQEVDRARDNFLYHVTHELRTPLTNIQAYAETLTRPAFDDEQTRRECYNVIVSETRRLSRLVEDILSISQLEVGSARVEMDELDLQRLIRQMVQDNLGAADERKIELTLKLPPRLPKIRGDKQRLGVLLNNLIGNAIKYTPNGGQVNVLVDSGERDIRIDVSDTGIGIAPADQPRIFDKFYRATSDAVQSIPGTGLGLAIAREVARLHGGDIQVHSELGSGSTFSLVLPVGVSGT